MRLPVAVREDATDRFANRVGLACRRLLRGRRLARSAILAVMTVLAGSALAGSALAASPPPATAARGHASIAAVRARAADPTITITAGRARVGDTPVDGLAGVTFQVRTGNAEMPSTIIKGSCTTDISGKCTVHNLTAGVGYWVVQTAVPAGWFRDNVLGTGTGADNIQAVNYPRVFTGTLTGDISVTVPAPAPNAQDPAAARGSVFTESRANPMTTAACGLRTAVLFDLSTSIISPTNHLPELKEAGESFVNALEGTPSTIALYTFGSVAPAPRANNQNVDPTPVTGTGASFLDSKINGFSVVSGQATNWDAGLWQIADSSAHYDDVIVLTDGDPTRFGPQGNGSGAITRLIDDESGIFSANALKEEDTKVIAVGINADRAGSVANLQAISGTTEGTDYHLASFDTLGATLRDLAVTGCAGSVNVTKLIIPASSPGTISAAEPAPGWTFSASGSTVTPSMGTTGATGAVSFATHQTTNSTENVTLTEQRQGGYVPQPVGGKNAVCTNSSGKPVEVTDVVGTDGFTVAVPASDVISCDVYNQKLEGPDPAAVIVNKSWVIGGVTEPDGSQDPDFQASLDLSPIHPAGTEATWGTDFFGYLAEQSVDIREANVKVPAGCSVTVTGDVGPHTLVAGLNEFSVTDTVTCVPPTLTLAKQIRNPFPGVATVPLTSWTLSAQEPDGTPVFHGRTGVTVGVAPGTYLLTESDVPGYRQLTDPSTTLAAGATGSWTCTDVLPGGRSGLEDFGGGNGTVTLRFGQQAICTATNVVQPQPEPTVPVTG